MKKYLVAIALLLVLILASAKSLDEAIIQLQKIKSDFETTSKMFEQQVESHPLLAPKSQFETSGDYQNRQRRATSVMDSLKYSAFYNSEVELYNLCFSKYEYNDLTTKLGNYDANKQTFELVLSFPNIIKKTIDVTFKVSPDTARVLYNNWSRVTQSSIITIDPGFVWGLESVTLKDAEIGWSVKLDFPYVMEFKDFNVASFSKDKLYMMGAKMRDVAVTALYSQSSKNYTVADHTSICGISSDVNSAKLLYANYYESLNVDSSRAERKLKQGLDVGYDDYVRTIYKHYRVGFGALSTNQYRTFDWVGIPLALSPDGEYYVHQHSVLTTADDTAVIANIGLNTPYYAAFNHSSTMVASLGKKDNPNNNTSVNYISVYNLKTHSKTHDLKIGELDTQTMVFGFSPDDRYVYYVEKVMDKAKKTTGLTVRLYEIGTKLNSPGIYISNDDIPKPEKSISSISISSDGKFIAITKGNTDIYDIFSGKRIITLPYDGNVLFTPDGKYFVVNDKLYRTFLYINLL